MVRKALLSLFLVVATTAMLLSQTSLEGNVSDEETGEPILFGNVALYKSGALITGIETDFDGNYSFSNIDPGTYDVEVSYIGYQATRLTDVVVFAGKANRLDFKLGSGVMLQEVVVKEYKVPLIEQDNTSSGGVVTADKIRTLASKDIQALAATTAGLSSNDGGAIAMRGSRTNATDYYIDGIRVSGSLVPESEIEQMEVITGGIGAQYGDVTGGIISITTKGPSNKLGGSFELETSQFLDAYGYNLANLSLSGPILRKKDNPNVSIIGYRLSARYRYQLDDNPRQFGSYRATEETINRLEENPLVTFLGTPVTAGDFLSEDDVELMETRPNDDARRMDFNAKIDARLTSNIDVSLSGSYIDNKNRFTPGSTANFTGSDPWYLLNWTNNPYDISNTYRGNFRFRHKLGNTYGGDPSELTEEDKLKRNSVIRNASYTLQFGYQKSSGGQEDIRHEDNLFAYGHVGNFDVRWSPIEIQQSMAGDCVLPFAEGIPTDNPVYSEDICVGMGGYNSQLFGYTPGPHNPALANYNNVELEDESILTAYNTFNGFRSSTFSSVWGNLHNNVGSVYNRFLKNEEDRYNFNISSSFDLFPGGSDKGRHNIQFGFNYEQRILRSYQVRPVGLWELARLSANTHILGVDFSDPIGTFEGTTGLMEGFNAARQQFSDVFGLDLQDLSNTFTLYNTALNEDEDALVDASFYKNIRQITGQSLHDYVNVDGIDPGLLDLSLFSAKELNDQFLLGYYGYDYLGNKLDNTVTFDDFFSGVNADGSRKFDIAPFSPIYWASFIQDKFTYKDIIFRLGLRVDYYDANTQVLQDPYSLYKVITADDFYNLSDVDPSSRPSGVQDEFKVYVTDPGSTIVTAFRDGDQWYNEEGTAVNSGIVLFGQDGIVNPFLVDEDADIKEKGFDLGNTFEDYTPQLNFMPRLAFSFPISDEANFFAHYDVLVQRPSSNSLVTARTYYYYSELSSYNNSNLRPERTIDYEVGFQQRLTQSSALKVSAYYKELRDMIQQRTYFNTAGSQSSTYQTYGNQDFGTVKGFSFTYDLRRTKNLEFTANYTLQFADGTGSDPNTLDGLSDQFGNVRVLGPLDFDERHRMNAIIDYRFTSGKLYNGPRIAGVDILANAGMNLNINAVSGRPYTPNIIATSFGGNQIDGGLNSARLPWNYNVDLRADKNFKITKGDKPLFLNVYFRVQNLLNTKNVFSVYSATGSPDNDGYLTSPRGLDEIEQIEISPFEVDLFLNSYQWRLLNGGFYSLPRRMYLGAIIEF